MAQKAISKSGTSATGKIIDEAMDALGRDNPRLGELIDLIGSIQLADVANRSKDVLSRVFKYFRTHFASAEGIRLDHNQSRTLATLRDTLLSVELRA